MSKPTLQEVQALLATADPAIAGSRDEALVTQLTAEMGAARAMATTGRRHGKTYALKGGRGPAARAAYIDEAAPTAPDTSLAREILGSMQAATQRPAPPQRMRLPCAGKTREPLGGVLPCPSHVDYTAVYATALPGDVAEAMRTAGWHLRRGVRAVLVWYCPNTHHQEPT